MNKVFDDIRIEREAQDIRWGGEAHDDQHAPEEWLDFIWRQVDRANDLIGTRADEEYRKRLIKIAALAVAAVESLDRYHEKSL